MKTLRGAIDESQNLKKFFTQAAGQSFKEFNDAIEEFAKEDIIVVNEESSEENLDQIDFNNYNKQEILKKWEAVLESSRKVLENNIELPGINDIVDAMSESHAKVLEQLGEDTTAKRAEYDRIKKLIEGKENEGKDDSEEHPEVNPDGVSNPDPLPIANPNGTTDQGNQNSTFNDKVTAIEKYINEVKTNAQELNNSSNFNNIGNFLDIENTHANGTKTILEGAKEAIDELDASNESQPQGVEETKENLNRKLDDARKQFDAALNNFKLRYIQHKVNNDILSPLKGLNAVNVNTAWLISNDYWISIGNNKVDDPSGDGIIINYNTFSQFRLNNVISSNIEFFTKCDSINNFVKKDIDKKTKKEIIMFNWGKFLRINGKGTSEQKEQLCQIMKAAHALFDDVANKEPDIIQQRKDLVKQALNEIMPK